MRRPVIIVGLLIAAWAAVSLSAVPSGLTARVDFFDVGQGDAALISAGNQQVLIDGGPDQSVLRGLGSAMPRSDRRIELIILTHPHLDHFGGLIRVLERYAPPILLVRQGSDDPAYARLLETAREHGTAVLPAAGQRIPLPGGSLDVIDPRSGSSPEVANPNDASVTVRLTLRGTTFLFPGDAETAQERRLVSAGTLGATVLKVPHHGSRTSSTPAFLEAVSPAVCVVSLGTDNRYGHPDPETMRRLADHGCRVLRTDQQGTVSVSLTDRGASIRTER